MRACQAAGPGSIPRSGQVSWVRFFFLGFSSPIRQMSERFRPIRCPNIIWVSESSFHIHLVRYRLSCSCCLGGGPGINLLTHPGRPSMSLCGQKSIHVIQTLNILLQNLMRMEYFEIYLLKLILKLITGKIIDRLNLNFAFSLMA